MVSAERTLERYVETACSSGFDHLPSQALDKSTVLPTYNTLLAQSGVDCFTAWRTAL